MKQTLTDRQMDTLDKKIKERKRKKKIKNNEEDWKGHLRLN